MSDTHDVERIADILNTSLTPDGWDIGALEHIAEYLAARGQCIYDHDDPSLDWNQANYEGNDDMGEGEQMMRDFQALGVEVPPKLLSETELEEARWKRDSLLERMDGVLDYGFYDYDIKFRVEGTGHEQFKEELAALILGTPCLEYDIKITPKFNPVRFDNQPF